MPTTPTHSYIHYANGGEKIRPAEQQLTDETVESMSRLNHFLFEKPRHAHAKSPGMLRGERPG